MHDFNYDLWNKRVVDRIGYSEIVKSELSYCPFNGWLLSNKRLLKGLIEFLVSLFLNYRSKFQAK